MDPVAWWLAALVAWVGFVFVAVKPRLVPRVGPAVPARKHPPILFSFILLGGLVSISVSFFMLRAMFSSGSISSYRLCATTVGERLAVLKHFGHGKSDQRVDWLDTATGKRVAASAIPNGARFDGQSGDLVYLQTSRGSWAWNATTGRRETKAPPAPGQPIDIPSLIQPESTWPKPVIDGTLVGVVRLHDGYALLYTDVVRSRSEVDAVDLAGHLRWRY